MTFLISFFVFIFGVIIGSFLNVVVLRMHTKKISKGRSKCSKCAHELSSKDLFPVFSFLFLRGRCRYCHLRMSWQYITVELITGFVFMLTAMRVFDNFTSIGLVQFIYFGLFATVFSLVIVMSTYDIKHFILPWKTMKFFILFSFIIFLLNIFLLKDFSFVTMLGFVFVPFPFLLIWLLSRGRLIGFGDIELMLGAGLLFGTIGGFVSIMLSFWIAMIYVVYLYSKNKKITGKSMIPFGPFIGLGIFVFFLYSAQILHFLFPYFS